MDSASTSPSSVSPGELVQRDIDTISVGHTLQGAPTSPRNAILSQTSLQRPAAEPTSAPTTENRSRDARALEKRRTKGGSDRRKRSTAHTDLLTNVSRLEVDRLRNDSRAESLKMRDLLETAVRQVHVESRRAEELQRINDETATKFRILNENRVSAQQDAAKAKTELKLYQFQLDSAQKEIEKAKAALKEIEKQRDEAEGAAARAREKARKYQQERLVAAAKEEGRRLGYEAGLKHAKKEKEILASRRPRLVAQPPPRSSKGKERAYYADDHDHHSGRSRQYSHGRNDTASSTEDSPPQSPKRNFRGSNDPAMHGQRMRPAPSTPAGPSRRPPATEEEKDDYESESEDSPPPSRPPRTMTPAIQYWAVDIPAADRLDTSFNSNENPNDAVPQGPRDEWVTATKHREIRGSPNPPIQSGQRPAAAKSPVPVPVPQNPQLNPSPKSQPIPPVPTSGPVPIVIPPAGSIMIVPPPPRITPDRPPPKPAPLIKNVKFWARPTLAKTKQQATSWYRSFSLRKKNKPVIDPIAEESSIDDPATEAQPVIFDSPDGVKMYGPQSQQTQSWYRSNGPASLRNHDISYARRQHSDVASVSTRVSQFDLLSTPAQLSAASISLPRAKNKGQVKEKESFLSVIKEDSSRGNTPDRPLGGGGAAPVGFQAMPIFEQPGFHPTHDSFSSSVQNRSSHRPPTIFVPSHDTAIPPMGPGMAPYQGYPSNTNLPRKTSIDINVVPPSGMPPDTGTSPPHTGINHLSPYHVFRPPESIRSLRDAVDAFADQPARPDSAVTNRQPGHSRSVSAGSGPGSPLQNPQAPFMTWNHDSRRSESRQGTVRPSTSNRHLRNTSSTATFRIANPDPAQPDNRSTRTRTPGRSHPDIVASGDEFMVPRREPSRASIKSSKSYSRYNPDEYVDPAFWGVGGPGDPPAALPAQPRPGMAVDAADMERAASRLSRRTSVNSGLSYA